MADDGYEQYAWQTERHRRSIDVKADVFMYSFYHKSLYSQLIDYTCMGIVEALL